MRRGDPAASSSNAASSTYQILRKSSKMNERGDFNGTCTKEEAMTITPDTRWILYLIVSILQIAHGPMIKTLDR